MTGRSNAFWFPGDPQAKGRPRFRRVGNFVQTYTPAKTAKAERAIRQISGIDAVMLTGPVGLQLVALFRVPKSWPKAKRDAAHGRYYTGARDLDNVVKLVQDALNGVAFADDRQIASIRAEARYAHSFEDPGISVYMWELEERHAPG